MMIFIRLGPFENISVKGRFSRLQHNVITRDVTHPYQVMLRNCNSYSTNFTALVRQY